MVKVIEKYSIKLTKFNQRFRGHDYSTEKHSGVQWVFWPLFILISVFSLGGCTPTAPNNYEEISRQYYLNSSLSYKYDISQSEKTDGSPAQYHICGDKLHPCHATTDINKPNH